MNHDERTSGSPSQEREAETPAVTNKLPRPQEAEKNDLGGEVVADRAVAGGLARLG